MLIHLNYKDTLIKGSVTYSAAAIRNIVLIRLEKDLPEVGKDIILFYSPAGWYEPNGLHSRCPDLFNEVVRRLTPVLDKCRTDQQDGQS